MHLLRLLRRGLPTDAITHGHGFELATLNATNLVMRKEDMLIPVSALTAAK
jgi:NADH-quinone oxidoreductase subunit I